ncbi:hypothetical protein ACHAXS_005333 [Conticribra weissflogii]
MRVSFVIGRVEALVLFLGIAIVVVVPSCPTLAYRLPFFDTTAGIVSSSSSPRRSRRQPLSAFQSHYFPGSHAATKPKSTRRTTSTSRSTSSTSTRTYLSDDPHPFFFAAAPSFSAPPSPLSSPNTPQSATVTLRLPLGTLFDGRDYVFVTESNVRGYEWTTKETDILLDDLIDAALANYLGGGRLDGASRSASSSSTLSSSFSLSSPVADYELSQIVLVPTSDWDPDLLGLGSRYDVYDGQQRLVTLSLLLAALRDSFANEAAAASTGGKRAVALRATAREIAGMLVPTKVRKGDVWRIRLRERDNVLLERILRGQGGEGEDEGEGEGEGEDLLNDDDDDSDDDNDDDHVGISASQVPLRELTPAQRTSLLSSLSPTNRRVLDNFLRIASRLEALTTRERLRLLDYMVERLYLLVCIPETSRIARNIVMAQGRKGMDNEPVDDFKGLVCFRYTLEEDDMYKTFDRWDALAAEPSTDPQPYPPQPPSENADRPPPPLTPVGRDVVSSACLLRASAALRTKIRSRGGGDEVYEWERWLRHELWLRNQHPHPHRPEDGDGKNGAVIEPDIVATASTSSSLSSPPTLQRRPWQGSDFFVQCIEPAAMALSRFRTGSWDDFEFLSALRSNPSSKKKKYNNDNHNNHNDNHVKHLREETLVRLDFLRDIVAAVPSAKEAEIVLLEWFLRVEAHHRDGNDDVLSTYLEEYLPRIETWTLWMAVARPSPMKRHARCFELLDVMDDADSVGGGMSSIRASEEDVRDFKDGMDRYEFGASAAGKRLALAILKRMNAHWMLRVGGGGKGLREKEIRYGGSSDGRADVSTVEFILPRKLPIQGSEWETSWSEDELRDEWINRIGNLAIVSSSSTTQRRAKGKNSAIAGEGASWEDKKQRYKKEPWPITSQLHEIDEWNWDAVKEQQNNILSMMDQVWSMNANTTGVDKK